MDFDTALVFGILGLSVLIFITEWLPSDVVAILVLVSVTLLGLVTPEEALSGLSSNAVAAIIGLTIVGAGLVRSGAIIWAADKLTSLIKGSERKLILVSTLGPGLLSGVINIVAAASVFIPAVMRLSRRIGMSPSRLLMPLAATALAGANLTIIGASHNLVVNSQLQSGGIDGFGFFELAPAGAIFLVAATLYTLLFGRFLLPNIDPDEDGPSYLSQDELVDIYGMTDRIWEVLVLPESDVVGKQLRDTGLGAGYGVSVIATVRAGSTSAVTRGTAPIEAGDILLIGGRSERVMQIAKRSNLELIGTPRSVSRFPLSEAELVEVIVPPRSEVVGKTLRELDFRNEHDLTAVAIWHAERQIRTDIAEHRLLPGDTLLLYGPRRTTRAFQPRPEYLWMNPPPEEEAPEELRHLALYAALILLGVIVVASLGLLSVGIAALAGAAATILIGILTPQQAYDRVGWGTVLLIAGMFPLGIALRNTGGADLISELLIDILQPYGTVAILAGLALVTLLLTQPIHNAAVAVIMTPVAIDIASRLDSNPHAFAAAVIIAASANFLLPMGHPAPLLVQAPGQYTVVNYLKFGSGLCVIAMLIVVLVVPLLWPL